MPEAIPYLALCLFAGLRPHGEANRMDWSDIHFDGREIDIRSEVSKTRDERFVGASGFVGGIRRHAERSAG